MPAIAGGYFGGGMGFGAAKLFLPRTLAVASVKEVRLGSRYLITGVTKDQTGAVLGNCVCEAFEAVNTTNTNNPKGRLVGMTTSDANGNYSIEVYSSSTATFNVDAYKAGSPDVAGTTLNTLTGTATTGAAAR